jgi:RNA polymerase sigma factor (sigma-70 family)
MNVTRRLIEILGAATMTHAQWLDELFQPTSLGAIRQKILWRLRSKIHETYRHMHDLEQIEIDVLNSLHTMLSRMDREPESQQLCSILYVIIDSKILDSIRSVNRRKRSHLTLQMEDMESVVSVRTGPDEEVQFEELKRLLLEQLEPRIRQVIQLRLIGNSNQQIADILGRSTRTVERAVHDSETVVARLFGLSLNSYRDKTRQDRTGLRTQDSGLRTQDSGLRTVIRTFLIILVNRCRPLLKAAFFNSNGARSL